VRHGLSTRYPALAGLLAVPLRSAEVLP
jgi:hypothetical protein